MSRNNSYCCCWIGIDPGKSGAIAAILCKDNKAVKVLAEFTPVTIKRTKRKRAKTKAGKPKYTVESKYNYRGMLRLLANFKKCSSTVHVAIEDQWARQHDSKRTVFQVGFGFGLWTMACAAVGLEPVVVPPNTWKPLYVESGANKAQSLEACKKLYPKLKLPLVKDEAKAEAVLIADYLIRSTEDLEFPIAKKTKKK